MLNKHKSLLESKQAISNLGFPEVVASIFFKIFGGEAYTFARWYREFSGAMYPDNKKWFEKTGGGALLAKPGIYLLSRLYDTLKSGDISAHNRLRDIADMVDIDLTKTTVERDLRSIKEMIEETMLEKSSFFRSNLVEAFRSGKIKTLQGYDHLPFTEAEDKYEAKTIFLDAEPVVTYPNGWRWINAGGKCMLVGRQMKNCGSTGTSGYSDSQLMVLFDGKNMPHVLATHIPQRDEITNPEGQATTEVKDEYLQYVVDLARILGATIRTDTKSRLLNMQQELEVPLESIKRIHKDTFNEYFLIKVDNQEYYADGHYAISKEDYNKVKSALPYKASTIPDKLKQILGQHNLSSLRAINPEVRILKIRDLRPTKLAEGINFLAVLFSAK